jgi:hypothetical protein
VRDPGQRPGDVLFVENVTMIGGIASRVIRIADGRCHVLRTSFPASPDGT